MISSDHLEPGQKGMIKATLDARNKAGRVVGNITVFSNDPKTPVLVFSLSAEVLK